jgi:hypothetical protein
MKNFMKVLLIAITAALFLTACGTDLSGNVYKQVGGSMNMTFEDDEYIEIMGTLLPYEIDDDKVLVGNEGEQQVWKILDNDNLKTPMGEFSPVD